MLWSCDWWVVFDSADVRITVWMAWIAIQTQLLCKTCLLWHFCMISCDANHPHLPSWSMFTCLPSPRTHHTTLRLSTPWAKLLPVCERECDWMWTCAVKLLLASLEMKRANCSVWNCSEELPFCQRPPYFSSAPEIPHTINQDMKTYTLWMRYHTYMSSHSASSWLCCLPPQHYPLNISLLIRLQAFYSCFVFFFFFK